MENPIKMDDLGVPLFSETSIYNIYPFMASRNMAVDISGATLPGALQESKADFIKKKWKATSS